MTSVEPGRRFVFETSDTAWTYSFEPSPDGGTELIESFEMTKDEPGYLVLANRHLLRIKDRKLDIEAAMQRALERIKAAAEGAAR